MNIFAAPVAFAKASYSASLLVLGKSRRIMHLTLSLFRLWSTIPALPAYLLEDLSMWMLHCGLDSTPLPSIGVNFVMKLAITCPFNVVRG